MEIDSIKARLRSLLALYDDDDTNADDIVYATFDYVRSSHVVAQMLLLEGRFPELQRCLDLCRAAFTDAIPILPVSASHTKALLPPIERDQGDAASRNPSASHTAVSEGEAIIGQRLLLMLSDDDRFLFHSLLGRTEQFQRQMEEARKQRPGRDTEYYIRKLVAAFDTASPLAAAEGIVHAAGHTAGSPGAARPPSPAERGVSIGRRTKLNRWKVPRELPPLVTSSKPFFGATADHQSHRHHLGSDRGQRLSPHHRHHHHRQWVEPEVGTGLSVAQLRTAVGYYSDRERSGGGDNSACGTGTEVPLYLQQPNSEALLSASSSTDSDSEDADREASVERLQATTLEQFASRGHLFFSTYSGSQAPLPPTTLKLRHSLTEGWRPLSRRRLLDNVPSPDSLTLNDLSSRRRLHRSRCGSSFADSHSPARQQHSVTSHSTDSSGAPLPLILSTRTYPVSVRPLSAEGSSCGGGDGDAAARNDVRVALAMKAASATVCRVTAQMGATQRHCTTLLHRTSAAARKGHRRADAEGVTPGLGVSGGGDAGPLVCTLQQRATLSEAAQEQLREVQRSYEAQSAHAAEASAAMQLRASAHERALQPPRVEVVLLEDIRAWRHRRCGGGKREHRHARSGPDASNCTLSTSITSVGTSSADGATPLNAFESSLPSPLSYRSFMEATAEGTQEGSDSPSAIVWNGHPRGLRSQILGPRQQDETIQGRPLPEGVVQDIGSVHEHGGPRSSGRSDTTSSLAGTDSFSQRSQLVGLNRRAGAGDGDDGAVVAVRPDLETPLPLSADTTLSRTFLRKSSTYGQPPPAPTEQSSHVFTTITAGTGSADPTPIDYMHDYQLSSVVYAVMETRRKAQAESLVVGKAVAASTAPTKDSRTMSQSWSAAWGDVSLSSRVASRMGGRGMTWRTSRLLSEVRGIPTRMSISDLPAHSLQHRNLCDAVLPLFETLRCSPSSRHSVTNTTLTEMLSTVVAPPCGVRASQASIVALFSPTSAETALPLSELRDGPLTLSELHYREDWSLISPALLATCLSLCVATVRAQRVWRGHCGRMKRSARAEALRSHLALESARYDAAVRIQRWLRRLQARGNTAAHDNFVDGKSANDILTPHSTELQVALVAAPSAARPSSTGSSTFSGSGATDDPRADDGEDAAVAATPCSQTALPCAGLYRAPAFLSASGAQLLWGVQRAVAARRIARAYHRYVDRESTRLHSDVSALAKFVSGLWTKEEAFPLSTRQAVDRCAGESAAAGTATPMSIAELMGLCSGDVYGKYVERATALREAGSYLAPLKRVSLRELRAMKAAHDEEALQRGRTLQQERQRREEERRRREGQVLAALMLVQRVSRGFRRRQWMYTHAIKSEELQRLLQRRRTLHYSRGTLHSLTFSTADTLASPNMIATSISSPRGTRLHGRVTDGVTVEELDMAVEPVAAAALGALLRRRHPRWFDAGLSERQREAQPRLALLVQQFLRAQLSGEVAFLRFVRQQAAVIQRAWRAYAARALVHGLMDQRAALRREVLLSTLEEVC